MLSPFFIDKISRAKIVHDPCVYLLRANCLIRLKLTLVRAHRNSEAIEVLRTKKTRKSLL